MSLPLPVAIVGVGCSPFTVLSRAPGTLSVLASLERSARGPPSRAQRAGTA